MSLASRETLLKGEREREAREQICVRYMVQIIKDDRTESPHLMFGYEPHNDAVSFLSPQYTESTSFVFKVGFICEREVEKSANEYAKR